MAGEDGNGAMNGDGPDERWPADRSRPFTQTAPRGVLWMFLGQGSKSALQISIILILARLLAPRDSGIVSAALVVVGFGAVLSKLGVGPAVVQRTRLEQRHLRTGFAPALIFGTLMAAAVFLLAGPIAAFFQMLGEQWMEVVTPFRFLVAGLVFGTSYKMTDSMARATAAVYRRAWRLWVCAALVTGGAGLGSAWGIGGAAFFVMIAIVVSFFLMALLSLEPAGCDRGTWMIRTVASQTRLRANPPLWLVRES